MVGGGGTADTEVCVFPNEIYRAPDVPSYEDVCWRLRRGRPAPCQIPHPHPQPAPSPSQTQRWPPNPTSSTSCTFTLTHSDSTLCEPILYKLNTRHTKCKERERVVMKRKSSTYIQSSLSKYIKTFLFDQMDRQKDTLSIS